MKRLSFLAFKKLFENTDYKDKEIIRLYSSVKKMDKEILSYYIDWVNTGEYPDITVENFDLKFLIEEYGLEPTNAFLVLSCLKTDPVTARFALLSHPQGIVISEEEKEKIREYAESVGAYKDEVENCDIDDIEV